MKFYKTGILATLIQVTLFGITILSIRYCLDVASLQPTWCSLQYGYENAIFLSLAAASIIALVLVLTSFVYETIQGAHRVIRFALFTINLLPFVAWGLEILIWL